MHLILRNRGLPTLTAFHTRMETHWLLGKSHVKLKALPLAQIHLLLPGSCPYDPSSGQLFSHSLIFRNFRFWHLCDMPSHFEYVCLWGHTGSGWPMVKATRMTLCGHIEIKTDRNGRDEKHCGSTTEVLLSP